MLAKNLYNLSEKKVIEIVGPLCREDMKKTGILASLTLAQFCLECGYGKSELAQNANNCFGMKTKLSGNTWSGSTWDGKSKYTKQTKEQEVDKNGKVTTITITADFRKYKCIEDSIGDHSAYLLTAKKDSNTYRYAKLKNETDYKKAAQLVKDGGYATDVAYVSKLCSIIEKYNLTQYDKDVDPITEQKEVKEEKKWYRVRKSWSDSKTQEGAYEILQNAINAANKNKNKGYKVFDNDGKLIYSPNEFPYLVMITAKNLNVYSTPGGNVKTTTVHQNEIYTIVAEDEIKNLLITEHWGKLKSGAGWINLKHTKLYT